MQESAISIRGKKICDRSGRRLFALRSVILDLDTGRILAFRIFGSNKNIISPSDIDRVSREKITLGDDFELHDPEEIVRVRKALDQKQNLLGRRVITESGIKLGTLINYNLDFDAMALGKLQVGRIYFKMFKVASHLIAPDQIVEIKASSIIVKDASIKINAFAKEKPTAFGGQPA